MFRAFLSMSVLTRRVLVGSVATAVVALILGLPGGPVAAQSEGDHEQARKLFKEGVTLFNRGQFVEACPKFEASLALFAGVGTRGKLAECYERVGRTASAWRLYVEVEKLAMRMNDPLRAKVAGERAKALEARLAKLTINPGSSVQLDGFKVERDKVVQPSRIYDIAVKVDPGSYRIHASAPGYEPWTESVQVAEGKSAIVAIPALRPRDTAGGPTRRQVLGMSLVGVGAVSLLGGTTYFGVTAKASWDKVSQACRDGDVACTPQEREDGADATSRANVATVFAAVGVVAAGAGAILWLRSGKSGRSREQAWRVTPVLGTDSVAVMLSGRL